MSLGKQATPKEAAVMKAIVDAINQSAREAKARGEPMTKVEGLWPLIEQLMAAERKEK